MMQENKVFEWKVFVRFVERKFELVSDLASHPVLDAIAEDLVTGALQWRDKKGHPVNPSKSPLAVTKSFLLPSEVNARPIMAIWQLDWNPKLELGLTAQEEYTQFGWKGALKLEEIRLRTSLKARGISLHKTGRAERLRDYARKHGIVNKSGEVPSVGSIRNAVFY